MRMSDPMGKREHHALFYTLVACTSFAQKISSRDWQALLYRSVQQK